MLKHLHRAHDVELRGSAAREELLRGRVLVCEVARTCWGSGRDERTGDEAEPGVSGSVQGRDGNVGGGCVDAECKPAEAREALCMWGRCAAFGHLGPAHLAEETSTTANIQDLEASEGFWVV